MFGSCCSHPYKAGQTENQHVFFSSSKNRGHRENHYTKLRRNRHVQVDSSDVSTWSTSCWSQKQVGTLTQELWWCAGGWVWTEESANSWGAAVLGKPPHFLGLCLPQVSHSEAHGKKSPCGCSRGRGRVIFLKYTQSILLHKSLLTGHGRVFVEPYPSWWKGVSLTQGLSSFLSHLSGRNHSN